MRKFKRLSTRCCREERASGSPVTRITSTTFVAAGVEDASWGGQLMKTRTRGARPRTWLSPALILVGIALLAGALYWYFHPVSRELVGGGIVSNPFEPPDFTLTDQFGRGQHLGSFRGRPI